MQIAGQIPIDAPDPSVILARDVNDDGKLDLVVANAFSTVAVLYGNGNGSFQNLEYFAAGVGLRSLSVADVNGDGTLDIVTVDEFFDEVSVLIWLDRPGRHGAGKRHGPKCILAQWK